MFSKNEIGIFFGADQNNPSVGFNSSGKHYFMNAGFTQPVNTVLHNYIATHDAGNIGEYTYPDKDFNRLALEKAAADACNLLKDKYKENLRIYVIKFRKQEQYGVLMILPLQE